MEMIRKFAKLSFFSHLEAYFSEYKDKGFEPPINKEGLKKLQSIFFFFQWVFSGSFPERDCFSGWKPYIRYMQFGPWNSTSENSGASI